MSKQQQIEQELVLLEERDGIIKPEAVLEFAESHPDSALHGEFEWDDTEAAKAYRIAQANQIIRVCVRVLPSTGSLERQRVFVSLPSDRNKGGGYRSLVRVMSDDDQRAELLASARKELREFERKYHILQELAGVFSAIRTTASPAA